MRWISPVVISKTPSPSPALSHRSGRVTPTVTPPPSSRPRLPRISTSAAARPAQNQVFDPIRNPNSLHTYISLSTASNVPLLTLWSASWCPSCRTIAPVILSLIRDARIGEDRGYPVNYAPVEFDAPDAQGLSSDYIITAIPTLLAFDPRRGEPAARLTDARSMADRHFLEAWIREQAERGGGGSAGGGEGGSDGGGGSIFGGLFRGWSR